MGTTQVDIASSVNSIPLINIPTRALVKIFIEWSQIDCHYSFCKLEYLAKHKVLGVS